MFQRNFMMVVLAAVCVTAGVQAKDSKRAAKNREEAKFFEVDLTKEKESRGLNQLDDGCYGCPVRLSFPNVNFHKKTYSISFSGSSKDAGCRVIGATGKYPGDASLFIDAEVETDSGDTCDVKVVHPDGKVTVLSIEQTGT